MKILIINPNSDPGMTDAIRNAAGTYPDSEIEIQCSLTEGAPKFIETYEDKLKAAPGMVQLVRSGENEYDAFIVACHCDPNLDLMKEITVKPVVGIGEASMRTAAMLGHSFSVVSSDSHSIPNKEALIRTYHLQDLAASVRAPGSEMKNASPEEKYLEAARLAVEEDMAEVIVLGCAGMAGLDKKLEKELGVPVLDGVICAIMFAAGLVRYGVSTSKIRRYNPEY